MMNMDTIKEITETEINAISMKNDIDNDTTNNNNLMKIPVITSINESSINISISDVISSTPCKQSHVQEKKTQKSEKKPKKKSNTKNIEPAIIREINTRPKRRTSGQKSLKEPSLGAKLRRS